MKRFRGIGVIYADLLTGRAASGSVTRDDNRGLTKITYNVINLPSHIEVGSDAIMDYIYDATGNKLGIRSLIGYVTNRVSAPDIIELPYRAEDRDYIGNYEFKNGELLRLNTPYGYCTLGSYIPYKRDYQGNNRNNADYYAYGLPVQGSEVKDPDPYLYGGKEFYSVKGINIYDFNARTYTPDIARFMQPDPQAGDYHWLSPYTFCGGDPINNIDLWGMETLALSKNDTIQAYASNVPDDPQKITIYSHGNYSGFDYNLHDDKGVVRNGSEFINAIKAESTEHSKIEDEKGLEIELKSCNGGADNPEGKPNIAKKISEKLINAFVTGPNGCVKIDYTTKGNKITDLTETVLDEKGIPMSGNNLTTTYFRGQKINRAHISAIRSMLRLQSRPLDSISPIIPSLLPIKVNSLK